MPVIQASVPAERCSSASTLRAPQQFDALHGVPFGGVASTTSTLQPVAVLDLAPDLVGLREQHAGVDREHARHGSMRMSMSIRTDSSFWKEQAMTSDGWCRSMASPERLLCGAVYTAHSPSPRMTWKGSLRCQSMK